MANKKNKIHNPQIVTDSVPDTITSVDFGRMWADKTSKKIVIALTDENNQGVLTGLITEIDKSEIQNSISTIQTIMTDTYFSAVGDVYATVVEQVNGDTHYDSGYDFFSDANYTENTNQAIDDYYSFFYVEVPDTISSGYLRTIETTEGPKHIRPAIGSDNYVYNNQAQKVVRYSKITLPFTVKEVVEIKFDNKDIIEQGFDLQSDKQTVLIYGDPEGFFINKRVKVRYLI